ncbi:MAG: permease-like cell division protein FtsX [Oscillospiraceae bacterium]|jgi:cell division transport system permease protein|nr:permease-like cell division protein FtsX [Oscillospiraceae bacterium]
MRKLNYFIKEGVGSIFTHRFMSFASVFIIVACLLIMGSFSLLALNVDRIIDTLEDENQIMVFIDENFTETAARSLEGTISAIPNVTSVEFVSREMALDSFKDLYEDSSLLEDLDADVLRDRYIVYLDDISQMAETQYELAKVDGVVKVNAHLEISEGFIKVRNIVSAVSLLLVAVLLVISLFIMSNTIKLTTFDRREEIAIMKMVGATSSFIRWPFVVQGLILGLLGALLAFLAQWGLYQLVSSNIVSGTGLSFISVIPFEKVSIYILASFLAIGLGVGIFGSIMAIKNYLKV